MKKNNKSMYIKLKKSQIWDKIKKESNCINKIKKKWLGLCQKIKKIKINRMNQIAIDEVLNTLLTSLKLHYLI